MTYAEYAKVDALNWSTLREMRRSPLHYRHRLENPREDTTGLALGRAVHTAVLEPERFPLEYVVFGGARRAGKEWEAFKEANDGLTILKADEFANVIAMRDAVHRHKTAMSYLSGGAAEQTVTWIERINGVEIACKARPDYIGSVIADLKSTGDAGPGAFGRTAARFGYHCQLAWYRRGVRAALGRDLAMVLVVVETDAPHDVGVYRIGDDAMWAADEDINALLIQVAVCRTADRWPGANETATDLQLPSWVYGDQESITDDDEIVFGKGATNGL
jgi:hypothetical protein